MNIDPKIAQIFDKILSGTAPSKDDCRSMLECGEHTVEAAMIRAVADAMTRKRFNNEGIILGQIGIELGACPANCLFCSFGEDHTEFETHAMSIDEILACSHRFADSGDLFALFFMTMHEFDYENLLHTVRTVRERLSHQPQIVINIGDFDRRQADELRAAGVNGAYHVQRIREGKDSDLDPQERIKTIRVIKEAGLDWYYCCEPVGPEHSPQELVDQMFLGVEYECFQHAAMRRVYFPTSPLAHHGQISELRLAQITAVVALASMGCAETKNIAVHEPNLIGLTSGANVVYAEAGANPRDTEEETSEHRGRDIATCKTMLYEAGFENLLTASGEYRSLKQAYLGEENVVA